MGPLVYLFPVLYAVFLWWFTTGAIMAVYGRSQRLLRAAFFVNSLILIAALAGLLSTRTSTDTLDVYVGFTCGVLIWGWQIVSYFLGIITGPQTLVKAEMAVTRQRDLFTRFRLALLANVYHELTALAFALILVVLVWNQPNAWALWVYLGLWAMHLSAKLTVFLGVRNFRIDLLPPQLQYIGQLVSKQSSNVLLPISIVIATSVTFMLIYQGIVPTASAGDRAGFLMLATMIGLGVWEHGLLVLPLPTTPWGWSVRSQSEPVESSVYAHVNTPHTYTRRAIRLEEREDDDSTVRC